MLAGVLTDAPLAKPPVPAASDGALGDEELTGEVPDDGEPPETCRMARKLIRETSDVVKHSSGLPVKASILYNPALHSALDTHALCSVIPFCK